MGNVFIRIGSGVVGVLAFVVIVTLVFLIDALELLHAENERWKEATLRKHHERVRELRREKMRAAGG